MVCCLKQRYKIVWIEFKWSIKKQIEISCDYFKSWLKKEIQTNFAIINDKPHYYLYSFDFKTLKRLM